MHQWWLDLAVHDERVVQELVLDALPRRGGGDLVVGGVHEYACNEEAAIVLFLNATRKLSLIFIPAAMMYWTSKLASTEPLMLPLFEPASHLIIPMRLSIL